MLRVLSMRLRQAQMLTQWASSRTAIVRCAYSQAESDTKRPLGGWVGALILGVCLFPFASFSSDGHLLPVRESCSCFEIACCLIVHCTPLVQLVVDVGRKVGSASIACRAQLTTEGVPSRLPRSRMADELKNARSAV